MRWSTRFGLVTRKPEQASRRKRIVFVCIGALLGGTIGYGIVTSGPVPPASSLDAGVLAWIVGFALVCGGLAAYSPERALLRPGGRFRWDHGRDDE